MTAIIGTIPVNLEITAQVGDNDRTEIATGYLEVQIIGSFAVVRLSNDEGRTAVDISIDNNDLRVQLAAALRDLADQLTKGAS